MVCVLLTFVIFKKEIEWNVLVELGKNKKLNGNGNFNDKSSKLLQGRIFTCTCIHSRPPTAVLLKFEVMLQTFLFCFTNIGNTTITNFRLVCSRSYDLNLNRTLFLLYHTLTHYCMW